VCGIVLVWLCACCWRLSLTHTHPHTHTPTHTPTHPHTHTLTHKPFRESATKARRTCRRAHAHPHKKKGGLRQQCSQHHPGPLGNCTLRIPLLPHIREVDVVNVCPSGRAAVPPPHRRGNGGVLPAVAGCDGRALTPRGPLWLCRWPWRRRPVGSDAPATRARGPLNHRACNVLSSKPEAGAVVREEGVVAGEQVHVGLPLERRWRGWLRRGRLWRRRRWRGQGGDRPIKSHRGGGEDDARSAAARQHLRWWWW